MFCRWREMDGKHREDVTGGRSNVRENDFCGQKGTGLYAIYMENMELEVFSTRPPRCKALFKSVVTPRAVGILLSPFISCRKLQQKVKYGLARLLHEAVIVNLAPSRTL